MANSDDIAKLLDQLSGSTAWQQAIATVEEPAKEASTSSQVELAQASTDRASTSLPSAAPSSRVSELLKLLDTDAIARKDAERPLKRDDSPSRAPELSKDPKDFRNIPFAEALAELANIAKKPVVIKHLIEIRDEQHRLERRYWERRQELLKQQEAQIKELKLKVSITGPLGTREVERLNLGFQRELSELEHDEFLPEWDRLLRRQQATLERIGVPLMFESTNPDDRNKQQQIVAVLQGLMDAANK